ncbi:MAG: Skp family chaperone for outer membrane protein [Planctomycetota bacterium]|jgi:Skp family chaperone for outer membrane proteins
MKYSTFIFLSLLSFNLVAAEKLAFINTKALLDNSPQAIIANKELQTQFGERGENLKKSGLTIQEMEKSYQNDSAIMSAQQKKKAEDSITQNKRKFQFEQQSLKEDVQTRQRELLQQVQVELRTVIQKYGKANDYQFIFTDSNVAYADKAVDITDEILKELKK